MDENIAPSIFDELADTKRFFDYATQGQRFANYIIDLVVFYIFNTCSFAVIGVIATLAGNTADDIRDIFSNKLLLYACIYINFFLLYFLTEGVTKGRSLGKLITGTVAVREDLSIIDWKEAAVRSVCRIVPFEPFSGLGGYP